MSKLELENQVDFLCNEKGIQFDLISKDIAQ